MEKRIEELEKEITAIKNRNKDVEADKAWETSKARIFVITLITYVLASLVLYIIDIKEFFFGALIPTLGYFLSTLSLPIIKKWWVKKIFNSRT